MTADLDTSIRASRVRVSRSRGAASGFLLLVLGAWAALIPFIGPYLNLAFTPSPNTAWHWTPDRGWLNVLPGALTVLGGLLLLLSSSRVVTVFGAWLGVVSGAWLIVAPALANVLKLSTGSPDPSSGKDVRALTQLVFFYGIGALILFVASVALGRLSVHSVRDVRAAERRVAAEEAAAAEEERRQNREREAYAARDREQERERGMAGAGAVGGAGAVDGNREATHRPEQAETNANGDAGATQHLPTHGQHYAGEQDAGQQYPCQNYPGQQQQGQQYPGQQQGQPQQGQQYPTQQPYSSAPPPPEQRN
jgi:hypothetical protein